VLGDLTAGWQRCRRVAGGPAGANEHGQLLASVAGTPPDAGLVVAVSLRRRWSAQVSHGSQQWQQTADSGCLQQQQQQQRRRSRQPPAAAGEAGDATSQHVRACARGQMAPGADRGCPGPGWCARSRARPQRGRVVPGDLTAGWQRCRRGAGGPAEADEHGQLLASVAGTPPDAGLVVAVSREPAETVERTGQSRQPASDRGGGAGSRRQ
jgi:hypothetical protein